MWKKFLLAAVLTAIVAGSVSAQVYVKPYTRSDGTTVQGHYRSAPNNTPLDNYSTRGNVNPYTGKPGTVDPYSQRSGGSGYSSPYSNNPYTGKPGTVDPYSQRSGGSGYSSPYSNNSRSPYGSSAGQSASDPN